MRILLIGNFSPPYEDEGLHNLSLLKKLGEEGNDCRVINISKKPIKADGITNAESYFDFVFKLVKYGWKKDVIHYLTKSYTRLSLLKFMTSVLIGRIFLAKTVVTLHSEMFSIFGQSRSHTGGTQSMHAVFYLVHKVICGDRHTCDSALQYYKKSDKFEIIPLFISVPEGTGDNERFSLKKIQDKNRVILFSNVEYPSLLFEVLKNMLARYPDPETGIVVSLSVKSTDKLRRATEEAAGSRMADNLVFIEPDDMLLMSMAYERADLVLRTMSCDGETLYKDFAFIVRKPEHSQNYVYFPTSLLLIKEGDVSDLCAYIFNNLLTQRDDELSRSKPIDFYKRIKDIYSS